MNFKNIVLIGQRELRLYKWMENDHGNFHYWNLNHEMETDTARQSLATTFQHKHALQSFQGNKECWRMISKMSSSKSCPFCKISMIFYKKDNWQDSGHQGDQNSRPQCHLIRTNRKRLIVVKFKTHPIVDFIIRQRNVILIYRVPFL